MNHGISLMHTNALTVIHKLLRREMFGFSQQLACAGPEDCESLRRSFNGLAELLQQHASHEEARFEPLLREQDPALARRLNEDHRRLEITLSLLIGAVARLDPRAFDCPGELVRLHLDWNRFLSVYLAHLDDEERTLFLTLQERLPPVSMFAESAKSRGAQGEEFLEKIWAVTTRDERMAIELAVNR
jgi:hypothetical protein